MSARRRAASALRAVALFVLGGWATMAVAAARNACDVDAFVSAALLAECHVTTDTPPRSFECGAADYPAPPPRGRALQVTDFGATPDDDTDDAPAIQKALDALKSGQWLVFPPGVYLQGASIAVKTPGVTLWGAGATLKATNPDDQAIRVAADKVSVYQFTLMARTQARGDQPLQARIAVYPFDETHTTRSTIIRGNRIVDDAGAEGFANASSAAGIFLFRAAQFRVEDNTVHRSLADGIHMTAGSRDGIVARNTVHETGDDTIAVVSYQKSPDGIRLVDDDLTRNILIVHNDVGGQYFGRGIAVVGGRNVAIIDNSIKDSAMAASVYIARESYWMTDGVDRVLVANNRIDGNQAALPAYNYRNTYTETARTEQAAVEIYSWVWYDEKGRVDFDRRLGVSNVSLCGNSIARVRTAGVRIGAGSGGWTEGKNYTGRTAMFASGPIERVSVIGNRMRDVRTRFDIHPVAARGVQCGDGVRRPRTSVGGTCPQGRGT